MMNKALYVVTWLLSFEVMRGGRVWVVCVFCYVLCFKYLLVVQTLLSSVCVLPNYVGQVVDACDICFYGS